jgi:hypothetical protein
MVVMVRLRVMGVFMKKSGGREKERWCEIDRERGHVECGG